MNKKRKIGLALVIPAAIGLVLMLAWALAYSISGWDPHLHDQYFFISIMLPLLTFSAFIGTILTIEGS